MNETMHNGKSEVYPRRSSNVRAVKLWAGKQWLEKAIQKLYPLELLYHITAYFANGDREGPFNE